MSGSNNNQPQAPPDLNAAIQALIQQQIAAASGQGQQVQLPQVQPPASQYSNDPSQGPDLTARIGLALGGGSLPGAPAELRQQMGKQALLNFGIGLLGAGRFSTPGEALAGGLQGAQRGLLGSEATQAGQQEYALGAQEKMAELGLEQQKNRTAALAALVPLMQMQGRLGLPPLFGGGAGGLGGPPGGGPGGGGASVAGDGNYPTDPQPGWSYLAQLPPDMQKMVQTAAAQTGMPVELLAAHKWNESRGQAAVPPNMQDPGGGSFGIMQMGQGALDDYNAKHGTKYTTADINGNPQLALTVGAGHWTDLQQQYGGNKFLASMAYARGPGATDAWIKGGSKYGDLPPGTQRVLGNIYGPGSFPGATPIPEALALNQRGQPPAAAPGGAVGPFKPPGTATAAGGPPAAPTAPAGAPSIGDVALPPDKSTAGYVVPGRGVAGGGGPAPVLAAGPAAPTGGAPSIGAALQSPTPGLATGVAPSAVVGPIVTPPQPQPPSAQPQPQPPQPPDQQPPTPPAAPPPQPSRHDLVMEKNPDGTYKMPNDQVSQNEFLEREHVTYSPQELQARGVILPDNPAEANAKFAAVTAANTAADNAKRAAADLYVTMKDPSDAIKQVNAANEQAQKANQDYATYLQGANEKNAGALQNIYQQQDDRNATAYDNQVTKPAAAKVAAQAQLDRELALAHATAGETRGTDALKTVNDRMQAASDRIDQLQLLHGLSANVGDATGIGDMKIGGRSLADLISLTGVGPEAWQEKAGAVQAFRNGVLNLTRSLREGGAATGEPRSNQDLNFVLGMAPSELQDPRTREGILTYLEQVNQRQLNIGAETSRLMQTYLPGTKDYMPYGQALLAAREQYKDFVPQMDATTAADPVARTKWASSLPDHSFFRDPSGNMHMWPPPAASQQIQQQAPTRSRGPQVGYGNQ